MSTYSNINSPGGQYSISGGDFLNTNDYYIIAFNYQKNADPNGEWFNSDKDNKDGAKFLPAGVQTHQFPDTSGKKTDCIKIPIQFLDDIKITERNPTYNNIDVLGRWEPLAMWSGMTTLKISLTLRYVAMGKNPNIENSYLYDEVWVDKITSLIKSLMYPSYYNSQGGVYNVPPRLFLKIGNLVTDMPCYMDSCSRDWTDSPKFSSFSEEITEDKKKSLNITTEESNQITKDFTARGGSLTAKVSEFLPLSQKLDIGLTSFYETSRKVDSSTIRDRNWRGVSLLGPTSIDPKVAVTQGKNINQSKTSMDATSTNISLPSSGPLKNVTSRINVFFKK